MTSAIEEIEFLPRSAHRIGVIETLTADPGDRSDLRAATGASSPTTGRILADFEQRRWVVRNGPTFELTKRGEFVAQLRRPEDRSERRAARRRSKTTAPFREAAKSIGT